jgi:hypothetical protein
MSVPWWYLATNLAPVALIALAILALAAEGLRRLWARRRRGRDD